MKISRRQFIQGLAIGATAAFLPGHGATELRSDQVTKLETEDAFLLTKRNGAFEEKLSKATYVQKLSEDEWLIWGEPSDSLREPGPYEPLT